MKTFYLTGSIIFTVLVLILAFENITAMCSNMFFFFYEIDQNPTIVTLALATLGIITGIFYHGFIQNAMATSEDEDDSGI